MANGEGDDVSSSTAWWSASTASRRSTWSCRKASTPATRTASSASLSVTAAASRSLPYDVDGSADNEAYAGVVTGAMELHIAAAGDDALTNKATGVEEAKESTVRGACEAVDVFTWEMTIKVLRTASARRKTSKANSML